MFDGRVEMKPTQSTLLRRKLARLWPDASKRDEAIKVLAGYGTEKSEPGVERVYLAILKLAEGRLEAFNGLRRRKAISATYCTGPSIRRSLGREVVGSSSLVYRPRRQKD